MFPAITSKIKFRIACILMTGLIFLLLSGGCGFTKNKCDCPEFGKKPRTHKKH